MTQVHELGSISAVAKSMGVSYKAAWEAVALIKASHLILAMV